MGALAMSEANAGSDVVSMKIRADKKGNKLLYHLVEVGLLKYMYLLVREGLYIGHPVGGQPIL